MAKIKVRFHLAKGENYLHWQVKIGENVVYYDPSEVCLMMTNARLVNHKSTAQKIFEGQNKTVCAWVSCDALGVVATGSLEAVGLTNNTDLEDQIVYNPKRQPNWVNVYGDILDGTTHKKIISIENRLYMKV